MERRRAADCDRRRFRRGQPGSQRHHLERFRAARAGARGTAFLRRLRSHGDRAAQPIEPRASAAAEQNVSGIESLLDDPRASPLKAVAPGLLPPCFIIGAGNDAWCLADSLALAQALSAAASPYELHVMEGLPHGFMQMSALEGCRAAMRLMWDFLARNV